MAFSQAHRPQANGRTEVAGKVLWDIMRKLFLEEARSWVLLLPMAIGICRETLDPELGHSPYRLVSGWHRPDFGISWLVVRECHEAAKWMADRDKLNHEVGDTLGKIISENLEGRAN